MPSSDEIPPAHDGSNTSTARRVEHTFRPTDLDVGRCLPGRRGTADDRVRHSSRSALWQRNDSCRYARGADRPGRRGGGERRRTFARVMTSWLRSRPTASWSGCTLGKLARPVRRTRSDGQASTCRGESQAEVADPRCSHQHRRSRSASRGSLALHRRLSALRADGGIERPIAPVPDPLTDRWHARSDAFCCQAIDLANGNARAVSRRARSRSARDEVTSLDRLDAHGAGRSAAAREQQANP